MRKWISMLLAVILTFIGNFSIPAAVRAENTEAIEQPYRVQGFQELYAQGKLKLPEGVQAAAAEGTKEDGLFVTATGAQFADGKCVISPNFSFNGKSVGRVEVDALAPKGVSVSIAVYLDNSADPIAVIPLPHQKKSGKWDLEGHKTADVLGQHITGSHQVSFQIAAESPEPVTVLLRSIEFAENSLPVVYFDLDETQGTILGMNQDPMHETECYGNMTVQIPEGYVSEYTNQALSTQTYDLEYIRGRGNSTWAQDKKPYKLKLSKKADLFGMGANKHWVLLANRLDNSMLRNKATYWLGQELGMPFTPKSVFVEVVMNGVYYGVYCLSEQVRVGKSRVDIDDLEDTQETKQATDEPTITGGYLLSTEPSDEEEKKSFLTEREQGFLIESPSFEDYENEAQYNYIKGYVQKTEDAIYGEGFRGKDGKGYGEWMDVDSAIDYYWIQEISMNGDAFATNSTYLYKKRNGKLYWGPLWDFDYVAWSSSEYEEEWETYTEFVQKEKSWFPRLFEDKDFVKKLIGRWPSIQEKLQSLCSTGGMLDQTYGQIATACQYDQEKWGMHDFGQEKTLTLEEEKERLKRWIQNRTEWISQNVETLVPTECTITFKSEGKLCGKKKILLGSPIDSLPTPPARKGYVFTGWFVKESDGLTYRLYPGYSISGSVTAKASWASKKKITNVEKLCLLEKDVYLPIWDDSYAIQYDIMPFGATLTEIAWSSSDEKVATVDAEGIVQFHKPGTAKITGTCHNGVKASFRLHILGEEEELSEITALTLNHTSLKLEPGKWAKLTVKAEPAACDTRRLTWISLDPKIADVTGTGAVAAYKEGKATVLAFDSNTNHFAKCKVTVAKAVKKGDTFTASYLKYKVTKVGKNGGNAICIGIDKASLKKAKAASSKASLKKAVIPASVKWKGKAYRVTGIGKKAFQKSGITSVTLGKNIESIGESAFQGCKKLSTVLIRSQKLKRIGKKAIQGIPSKAVIKAPKKKAKPYQRLLKPATGYRKTMLMAKM